jgi:hypothetical protein
LPWRFPWTVAVIGMLVCGTVFSMAMVGFVHQAGWLAGTRGRIFNTGRGFSIDSDVRSLHSAVKEALPAESLVRPDGRGLVELKLSLRPREIARFQSSYRCYVLVDETDRFAGVALFGPKAARPWVKPVQVMTRGGRLEMSEEEFGSWQGTYSGRVLSFVLH